MIPKLIFLDFDGVVIDSNGIKDDAFAKIFSEYPQHVDEMMKCHLEHNAVPRSEKFRFVGEKILKFAGAALEKFVVDKTRQFQILTDKALIECPECVGATEFLNYFKSASSLVLISATPTADLNRIVSARNLDKFFSEVFGAPIVKSEIMKKVMSARSLEPKESLFIGDSPEDLIAAKAAGVPFVGVVGRTNFKGSDVPVYPNLKVFAEHGFRGRTN